MHNLISTGPYPPGQINPAELPCDDCDRELEELIGLGFLPLVPVLGFASEATGITPGTIWGGITGIFGDTPDHDPRKVRAWAQSLSAGGGSACAEGVTVRTATHDYGGDFGRILKDETIQFDVNEVREAIRTAPRGRPHGEPGTVEGLRTALVQPMPELAEFTRSDDALARIAVGVAHGRLDCGVGWQEEPTVVHLRQLVHDYEQRPQAQQPVAASILPELPTSLAWVPGGSAGLVAITGAAALAFYLLTQPGR